MIKDKTSETISMSFDIGDVIIYKNEGAQIEGLAGANERMLDWAVVLAVTDTHVATYLGPSKFLIPKESLSHAPYSRKAMKSIMNKSLDKIQGLVEAREARRIMRIVTGFSDVERGPVDIICDFLVSL